MKLAALLLLTTALLFSGCDIFSSRDAQLPEVPRSNYEIPSTPEILVQNLVFSLSDKNSLNYLSTFSDSNFSGLPFTFVPSASASSQYPNLLQDWGKVQEEIYFKNVIVRLNETQTLSLVFSDVQSNPQGDSVIYNASYFLTVPHNDAGNPKSFQGELQFKMIRDSRLLWSIYYWRDIKTSDLPTWSDLKGIYY